LLFQGYRLFRKSENSIAHNGRGLSDVLRKKFYHIFFEGCWITRVGRSVELRETRRTTGRSPRPLNKMSSEARHFVQRMRLYEVGGANLGKRSVTSFPYSRC